MPEADDKREATENEEATEGAKEGTCGCIPTKGARAQTGVIGEPIGAGGRREEGNEATEDEGTRKEGVIDDRERQGVAKEEKGKSGAETEEKEEEGGVKGGGKEARREN